jgi:uncharacterized protein (TIGR00251 family)
MCPSKHRFHNGKKGAALAIRVTPRAKKNEVSGIMDDGTIKIRLIAPPVEGKANASLIKFLAEILGVSRSKIEIIAGESGRDKLISILDMDSRTAQEKILLCMG